MLRLIGFILFFCFASSYLFAQTKIAVDGISINVRHEHRKDFSSNKRGMINTIPKLIVSFFVNNPELEIVDLRDLKLVKKEREIQKSEIFIDGYVVDQTKSKETELICRSFFDTGNSLLTIRLYDNTTGKVVWSEKQVLKSRWWRTPEELNRKVTMTLLAINFNYFKSGYPVVRATKEKKGKAKELLILAGALQKVAVDWEMDIMLKTTEVTNGEKVLILKKIGEGVITNIEGSDFSLLDVKKGKKEISSALAKEAVLECFRNLNEL